MAHVSLHQNQSKIFKSLFLNNNATQFVTVSASRGFGKSMVGAACATNAISELSMYPISLPNKNVSIIASTYSQVVDIYYPLLAYQFGLEGMAVKSSRNEGYFDFANGVRLKLWSSESVERMRGSGQYFVVIDELPSFKMKESAKLDMWESIVNPCIITRWGYDKAEMYSNDTGMNINPGKGLFISTPKGYDTFYDLYCNGVAGGLDEWKSFMFDYTTSKYLSIPEIEKQKLRMDKIRFNREYGAKFTDSGLNVFYMWNTEKHVIEDITPEDEEEIHIAIDFNVMKQCSAVCVIRSGQLIIFDELYGSPDTEQLAELIHGKYVNSKRPPSKVFVYPDPSGNARKTSATMGRTDFSILRSHGFSLLARSAHPPIVDSVNAVNAMLENAAGKTNLFVCKRCKGVRTSMERTVWVENNPDTAVIDKSAGVEHYSDGIRYLVEYRWPILAGTKRVKRGFKF